MTIFGNRDSGFGAQAGATADADLIEPAAPVAELPRRPFPADTRRVILRVHGGDDIVVGAAEGREPAVQIAREMVQHIEQATGRGEWPQIDERFIRPGAIVSIDVQRPE